MNDRQQLSAMGEHMREMEECKPEFKVPDGWKLVTLSASTPMINAAYDLAAIDGCNGAYDDEVQEMYHAMLSAAPEYKQ